MQAVEGGRISAKTQVSRVSSKPATETVGAHAHRLIVLLLQQSAWHTTPPAHCSMTGIAVAWSGDAWGSHAYSSSPRPFPLSIFFFSFGLKRKAAGVVTHAWLQRLLQRSSRAVFYFYPPFLIRATLSVCSQHVLSTTHERRQTDAEEHAQTLIQSSILIIIKMFSYKPYPTDKGELNAFSYMKSQGHIFISVHEMRPSSSVTII